MSKHEWESMNDKDFDTMLENCVSVLPPEDIVSEVTPWKKAMYHILWGMALGSITLNFWCLNYILPAIGMMLSLLGFRSLRKENKWFRNCFAITVLRSAYLFTTLILNTTIVRNMEEISSITSILTVCSILLLFIQYYCFWQGLRTVQQKAGLPPHAGSALMLIVWYAFICLLAFVQYSGLILAGAMIIIYCLIIRNLYKLSKELDEAGYAIQTAPVKIPDQTVILLIAAILLIGCTCGYLFGGSYPMDWQTIDTAEHDHIENTKTELAALGFPEYVLDDLTAEDIAACNSALQIVVDVNEYPVNNGRIVTTAEPGEPDSDAKAQFVRKTVYDVKELQITGVGVQLPGEREKWMIFQHFLWKTDPGFYGTESIQLWPPYYHNGDGWGSAGDVTGRVLYDNTGKTFAAPYYSLGKQTYTSNSIFWGEQTSTDIFAAFSMPSNGENHRGYIAYPIIEMEDGWITDCWFNYTHQKNWLQYPVMTATEKRMTDSWSDAGAFKTIQDALQFYTTAKGTELLGD